jgi:hypothetical protein
MPIGRTKVNGRFSDNLAPYTQDSIASFAGAAEIPGQGGLKGAKSPRFGKAKDDGEINQLDKR